MYKIFIALLFSMVFIGCNSAGQTQENQTEQAGDTPKPASGQASGSEASDQDPADAPVITWDEAVFSFGEIQEGKEVKHTYTFTNTGKSPLIISDVKASCGCTTPEFTKAPVKPGEKGNITVVFNSAGQRGKQQKIISVMSNANPKVSMVQLKGEVKETT